MSYDTYRYIEKSEIMNKEFKKLSNDKMSKLILSNKTYMTWFLERFLKRKIKSFQIINKIDGKEINEKNIIELLNKELETTNVHTKNKTVDLLVKTNKEIIDIEINNTFDKNIRKRNFAYMTNIYSNSLKHGQDYDEQPKCTQINICNNIEYDYDYDNHYIIGEKHKNKFIDDINFLVYDIAKYKKILYTNNNKLINKYAHLIIFDCNEEELELLGRYNEMAKEIGKMIKEYNEENIYSFLTDAESYEKLYQAQLETAKEEAAEKGLQQGLQQGIEQGIEMNKIKTAISLIKENIPINIISRTTGYSEEYLQTIKI